MQVLSQDVGSGDMQIDELKSTTPKVDQSQGANLKSLVFRCSRVHFRGFPPAVTADEIRDVFGGAGVVQHVMLSNHRYAGHGLVMYNDLEEAKIAMELFDYFVYKEKLIRVHCPELDSMREKDECTEVIIENIISSIDEVSLKELAMTFGKVISCKLHSGNSTRNGSKYGVVKFDKKEDAGNIIRTLDGMYLNDQVIQVSPFFSKSKTEEDEDERERLRRTVFLSNLSESFYQLQDYFLQCGYITGVLLEMDEDGRSKGEGYVRFRKVEDADFAVKKMDGHKHDNKIWSVKKAPTKFEEEKSGKDGYIQVDNLHGSVSDEPLREMFFEFGPIRYCKVMCDPQGQSIGTGFVEFFTPADATRAVNAMNGKVIVGKILSVSLFEPKDEKKARLEISPFFSKSKREEDEDEIEKLRRTVFVSNLSERVYQLEDYFLQCGSIIGVDIEMDENGRSNGVGSVSFRKVEDADFAVKKMDGHKHDNKIWSVKKAPIKFEQEKSRKFENLQDGYIQVDNLHEFVSDETLREMFSEFGPIKFCKVMCDSQGQSIGTGFVEFFTPADSTRAVNAMNEKVFVGNLLSVSLFEPKEEKKAKLELHSGNSTRNGSRYGVVEFDKKEDAGNIIRTLDYIERDEDGRSKGVGYVSFRKVEDADLAVKKMDGHKHDDKIWSVKKAPIKFEQEKSRKFEHLQDDATRAVKAMNGKVIVGNPLSVSLFEPKDESNTAPYDYSQWSKLRSMAFSGTMVSFRGFAPSVTAGELHGLFGSADEVLHVALHKYPNAGYGVVMYNNLEQGII
ncbi:hypothetical protein ACHQM5_027136 [Ranunculus cassubicifolius]